MKLNSTLKTMLWVSAGAAAVYVLLNVTAAFLPEIPGKLVTGPDISGEDHLLVSIINAIKDMIPLILVIVASLGLSGKEIDSKKSSVMLILSAVYFAVSEVLGKILSYTANIVAARFYSAQVLAGFAGVSVVSAFTSFLVGISWTLLVAVTAIAYYETHKTNGAVQ